MFFPTLIKNLAYNLGTKLLTPAMEFLIFFDSINKYVRIALTEVTLVGRPKEGLFLCSLDSVKTMLSLLLQG